MKSHHVLSLSLAALMGGALVAPVSAAVVDDFESYSTGNLPIGATENWHGPAPAISGGESITVVSDGNNLSGQHLVFNTTYPANGISLQLPSSLSSDGDYVQYAVRLTSGQTYAGMLLLAADISDPNAQPPGAFGVGTDGGGNTAFTVHHNGIYNYANYPVSGQTPWVTGATPSYGTWYYLRATMRDNGGAPGVVDSYDVTVYDSSMITLASKTGVPIYGGEGAISYIALVQNEQAAQTAPVLFDQITTGVVPEPTTLGLLAGLSVLGLARRRRV